MGKFLNPFTDVGFKLLFGREISKDLLIDFLNNLLKGERVVRDVEFMDKEKMPRHDKGRVSIYDVHCRDENGNEFIVEMQNASQAFFKDRALYYLSSALADQGEGGAAWKFDIKAVYGVFFMNFCFSDAPHKLRTDVVLADRDSHALFSSKMRMIFIQLPEFNKEENECENDFQRWIYILKHMDTLQRLPFQAQNAVFKKLESIANLASLSRKERRKYDSAIKAYRDYHNQMDFAKEKGIAIGEKRGELRGIAIGEKKGIAIGEKKGIAIGEIRGKELAIADTARNLKALGIPFETIQKATGLSCEEIQKL